MKYRIGDRLTLSNHWGGIDTATVIDIIEDHYTLEWDDRHKTVYRYSINMIDNHPNIKSTEKKSRPLKRNTNVQSG